MVRADLSASDPAGTPVRASAGVRSAGRLPRLTGAVFHDLAIWMIGLGLVTGACFPFLVLLLGVEKSDAFTFSFFGATLLAGLTVGGLNFLLARLIVGVRLRALSGGMQLVAHTIEQATETGDWSGCDDQRCRLVVDSDDELGDGARAFNELLTELERFHRVDSAVRDLLETLSSNLDVDTLASSGLRWVSGHIGSRSGAILLTRNRVLQPVAACGGVDPLALSRSHELSEALRDGALRTLPRGTANVEETLRVVPIMFGGERLAALVIAEKSTRSTEDVRVLDLFARAFGVALKNAITHAGSQELARLDPLTGCANRRSGLERLDGEFAGAERDGERLGVLMIDLDHFKRVNDTYGHLIGDAVLVRAAATIGGCLRDTDTLVRYGGEEFLVLLPAVVDGGLRAIGERIRAALAATPMTIQPEVAITASVGAAAGPTAGIGTVKELLEDADRALYRAKAAGRNRVELAGAVVGDPAAPAW